MQSNLRRAEAAIAACLTIVAIWIHIVNATFVGALWRDEVNTIGLVTLPRFTDVWNNLQFDSFPIIWILVLRLITGVVGPMNDAAFRTAGLLIGLAIIGALWINARAFGARYPLVSLGLFALNPSVIRWGDSLRAYGLGIATVILVCASLWSFIVRPTWPRFALCMAVAVISVHTVYYNAGALLAFGAGAIAVCVLNRAWRNAAAVSAIGIVSAASLLPYLEVIRRASSWNSLVRIPAYNFTFFSMKLDQAISAAGSWAMPLWCCAVVLAMWAGTRETMDPGRLGLSEGSRDAVVFGVVSMFVGVVSQFTLLRTLSYLTQPWYYLILLTVVAICFEIIAIQLVRRPLARAFQLTVITVVGLATAVRANDLLRSRITNADIAANEIQKIATSGDVIVISPWYVGLTFNRYYHGSAAWTMLPHLGFERYHRYDLLKQAMQKSDQRAPAQFVIARSEKALRSGHSVYMIGYLEPPATNHYVVLPPARIPPDGWKSPRYQRQWASMVNEFLRDHSTRISKSVPGVGLPTSEYENVFVLVATGWRD